ncbi:hypothetical protein [Luteibacter sp.]|uniref:hypothetical protein n=1 Tax=Luteibacter sp. TaxID=1886636 RepID=UPI003F7F626D
MKATWFAAAIGMAISTTGAASTVIPTSYEAGHFFTTPTTLGGKTLRFNTDTGGGGGFLLLRASVAAPMHLTPARCFDTDGFVIPPTFAPGKGIPHLDGLPCHNVALVPDGIGDGMDDGVVSAWYLSRGIWTFDYPAHRLTLEDATWKHDAKARAVPLGFPTKPNGDLEAPYPRIAISVEGESFDLLLDTGATAHPTATGKKLMGTPVAQNGYAATSYITSSVMNRWHAAHPDWPLVDDADDLFGQGRATRAIRVPSITLQGWSVGPVWFTERADKAFSMQGLSAYMDKQVHGALGGNVLSSFRMTIDYAHRTAWLLCADCQLPP